MAAPGTLHYIFIWEFEERNIADDLKEEGQPIINDPLFETQNFSSYCVAPYPRECRGFRYAHFSFGNRIQKYGQRDG